MIGPPSTAQYAVEIYPPDVVQRRAVQWGGMAAEVVQATRREKLEIRFRAPLHLLTVCDQGIRSDGDTFVEGLPRSRLRDARRKLTFVPAATSIMSGSNRALLTRIVYFYFDPARMPAALGSGRAPHALAPRLFFDDAALVDTALKLMRLIEHAGADSGAYFGALGIVLAHELVRQNAGAAPHRGARARRACRLATAHRRRLHRGTSCRADLARDAWPAGSPQPALFLPGLQAIVRHAAASLSQQPSHRARQGLVGQARVVGDEHRIYRRLQRDELVHRRLSQDHRLHADRLSARRAPQ